MDDIYLKYRKEREGIEYILVEGAFATFKPLKEHLYLEDLYCIPELRDSGIIHDLVNKVEDIAKKAGYKKILGSVDVSTKNAEANLVSCIKHGYKILKLDNSLIWLEKEI
jgi:GNAT superfamily N-acetyltransferase